MKNNFFKKYPRFSVKGRIDKIGDELVLIAEEESSVYKPDDFILVHDRNDVDCPDTIMRWRDFKRHND